MIVRTPNKQSGVAIAQAEPADSRVEPGQEACRAVRAVKAHGKAAGMDCGTRQGVPDALGRVGRRMRVGMDEPKNVASRRLSAGVQLDTAATVGVDQVSA